jgi:hypothetical protein
LVFAGAFAHNRVMKTLLLALLVALNVNAQKKKDTEYLSTGPSLQSIKRMYDAYNKNPTKRSQDRKYLEHNLYAYNQLQKVFEPEEKAQLNAFLEANYFRQLCLDGNARNAKKNGGKVKDSNINCSTYAIKVSNYSKYSPKYTDDKRSKVNPPVKVDFENHTYTIGKETFSIKTGNYAKVAARKKPSKKVKASPVDSVEDAVEPAVKEFLPKPQPAVESNH